MKLFGRLSYEKIQRYNNSPPYVTARWPLQQIPPFNFLAITLLFSYWYEIFNLGLNYAGIYRLAGVKSKVEHLKSQYNSNKDVNLKDYDPTIVTSLFKLYLRELPESVLTTALLPQFEEASSKWQWGGLSP